MTSNVITGYRKMSAPNTFLSTALVILMKAAYRPVCNPGID
jgi:hypothetical protein